MEERHHPSKKECLPSQAVPANAPKAMMEVSVVPVRHVTLIPMALAVVKITMMVLPVDVEMVMIIGDVVAAV